MTSKILLGERTSNRGNNVENSVNVDLNSDYRLLPTDIISDAVDSYEQYFTEKDASKKFRLSFTINPLCSNVLFNNISEIIYKEGSDEAIYFGTNGVIPSVSLPSDISSYNTYKGGVTCNRLEMIRDTGYSHEAVGGVVYHCGYDIFSNHTLRAKEFHVVNKIGTDSGVKTGFNTLSDLCRDHLGNVIQNTKTTVVRDGDITYVPSGETFNEHAYMYDTVDSFRLSIDNNLVEKDGWFGFINPCTIAVPNYVTSSVSVSLNKCMNNNKAGEFIDMYPDRSLFSFIPKFNKYRRRKEDNWDICLTYPYTNYYDNPLIEDKFEPYDYEAGIFLNGVTVDREVIRNGLRMVSLSELFPSDETLIPDEGAEIVLRSEIKHNFKVGDTVYFSVIYDNNADSPSNRICDIHDVNNPVSVTGIGSTYGDVEHHFVIRYSDVAYFVAALREQYYSDDPDINSHIYFRCAKSINGRRCDYYFRLFKKIPNFNGTNVYNKRYVSQFEIDTYCKRGFSYNISKMGFERTIYNDNKAQILFNEDVDLSCLRDNVGRELSQIYLTIVKRNKGYDSWYSDNLDDAVRDDEVEFSHCFGKLTAGLDLPDYVSDYNVHKIHNIPGSLELPLVHESPKNLENNDAEINIEGDETFTWSEGGGTFFGDIVEFNIDGLSEEVLEDVYFRFNTAQREYLGNADVEYPDLVYDEIRSDDYDISDNFTITSLTYNIVYNVDTDGNIDGNGEYYRANLNPEGYYYKAHYPIQVKRLSPEVSTGQHIRLNYTPVSTTGNTVRIVTDKNYYVQSGDVLYLYRKTDKHQTVMASVLTVGGDDFTDITFVADSGFTANGQFVIENYSIYKKNPLEPDYAYELTDGSGRYKWREIEKEVNIKSDDELFNSMFTNGAYYFHKNINFFLKRQDPNGLYKLKYGNGSPSKVRKLVIDGEYKNMENKEYIPTEDFELC